MRYAIPLFLLTGCAGHVEIPPRNLWSTGTVAVMTTSTPAVACGKAAESCVKGALEILPDPCPMAAWDHYAALKCHEDSHRFKGYHHEDE